jgi:hypothetical protein
MELKNAIAVCLISLFSATLVVLIARALDLQTAARIEPQLASIAEELQALRKQGGIAASPTAAAKNEAADDGLIVYYFHSNTRCPTCQSIESQSHDAVKSDFATQLSQGQVTWKVLNYEQPASAGLAKKFDIQMPVVVLAKMKDGQVQDWKRLDEVWGLVGDKPAFAAYVRGEIRRMLGGGSDVAPSASASNDKPVSASTAPPRDLPVPAPASLPLPAPKADLPLPK